MKNVDMDALNVPFEQRSFTVAETAAILRISQSHLFNLIAAGAIESFKIGRSRRLTGAAINAFRQKE